MSSLSRALVVAAIIWGIAAVVWSPPASAASSLTVTPHADLTNNQLVTIEGSGWPANTDIGYCEGVADSTPSQADCIGGAGLVTSSATGSFSVTYHVVRSASSPEHGQVNCAVVQCAIAAAVFSDIANTIKTVDISFNPAQIDVRLKQRSSGAIKGDDVYNDLSVENFRRTFGPGGSYAFAFEIQNDGTTSDDAIVKVTKEPVGAGNITARYFVGYYDVTAPITGAGVRIRNIAPGQIRGLAVKVSVGSTFDDGERATFSLSFASGAGGGGDSAQILAIAHTS
jgi:hypothetical protein